MMLGTHALRMNGIGSCHHIFCVHQVRHLQLHLSPMIFMEGCATGTCTVNSLYVHGPGAWRLCAFNEMCLQQVDIVMILGDGCPLMYSVYNTCA